jgi:hypothetical protein
MGDPIYTYTRAQAIEDGVLVDVTEWASADRGFLGGFRVPVALTGPLWAAIEAIPASATGADVRGRAHDVLWMASLACRTARRLRGPGDVPAQTRHFVIVLLPSKGTRKRYRLLRVESGPGDAGEHVLTIGFPEDF